jgi:DNA-binding NarL/FixJ family response regulator
MSALIVGRPGFLQDSLRSLLLMVPGVERVLLARDVAAAKRALEEHRPRLVLLEADLPGEGSSSLVRWIKGEGNRCRCLVLADDVQQQRKARAAGADLVLLKGFPAAKLLQVVEGMLADVGRGVSGEPSELLSSEEVH